MKESSSNLESPGTGGVFAVKGRTYRREDDKSHLKCTHSGSTRHTRNECFKIVGYPEWWSSTKKTGERKSARFSDHNRTGRAAVGWSTDEPSSMEEGEKQGAAMNITGIKGGEGDLLSNSNDAQEQQKEIGLRGVGCGKSQEPQPFKWKENHVRHIHHPIIFHLLLILHLILKGVASLIVVLQIQCHMTRTIS